MSELSNIVIYTGPGCSHCEVAKALLKAHNLAFRERDVSDPVAMDELREKVPRMRSLPQIFADGVHLGNDEDLRSRLQDH